MKSLSALLLAVCVLSFGVASAHTTVATVSPKSGTVLAASPASIEIQFAELAKLTSVIVTAADGHERKLDFAAAEKPNTFTVSNPALAPGQNEVKWKALSHDGHVISGTLKYEVRPK